MVAPNTTSLGKVCASWAQFVRTGHFVPHGHNVLRSGKSGALNRAHEAQPARSRAKLGRTGELPTCPGCGIGPPAMAGDFTGRPRDGPLSSFPAGVDTLPALHSLGGEAWRLLVTWIPTRAYLRFAKARRGIDPGCFLFGFCRLDVGDAGGVIASVGMLATEAERFRSREDRDGGSSEVPEPRSQRKRRNCVALGRDERERRKAKDEGDRARSPTGASVGHADRDLEFVIFYTPSCADHHVPQLGLPIGSVLYRKFSTCWNFASCAKAVTTGRPASVWS